MHINWRIIQFIDAKFLKFFKDLIDNQSFRQISTVRKAFFKASPQKENLSTLLMWNMCFPIYKQWSLIYSLKKKRKIHALNILNHLFQAESANFKLRWILNAIFLVKNIPINHRNFFQILLQYNNRHRINRNIHLESTTNLNWNNYLSIFFLGGGARISFFFFHWEEEMLFKCDSWWKRYHSDLENIDEWNYIVNDFPLL